MRSVYLNWTRGTFIALSRQLIRLLTWMLLRGDELLDAVKGMSFLFSVSCFTSPIQRILFCIYFVRTSQQVQV